MAVRWYLRYGLSYRDVEELLAERGVTVDHITVYRWAQRFTPGFIEAARFCRHAPGSRWFADETYVEVTGRWTYLYRAIDQHGQVIDVLLSQRRDLGRGPTSLPATGSAKLSARSRWPSDHSFICISVLCPAHRSANATLPVRSSQPSTVGTHGLLRSYALG